ncbi:MAG: sigma-E factor regulatory protein RseB domain-containing protein [Actinomycetes bacterium]
MRRYAASTGSIAILGPLALLSMFLIQGSVAATASLRTPVSDPQTLQLLDRAAQAPALVTYRGTQFVSAWTEQGSTGLVVDVVHRAGDGTTVRTAGTATTPATHSFVPANASEPSLMGGVSTLTLLGQHFDLGTGAPASVAGRPTDVVVVTRPGAATPAARFWLDKASGLVLRREVYDEQGRTTRASAFVDISVGDVEDADDHDPTDPGSPHAWPQAIDAATLAKMRQHGWTCPDRLPPSLQLMDARRSGGGYGSIVHLSYSDGLASVSVFEQHGRLQVTAKDGYRATTVAGRPIYVRDGVPQRMMWAANGTVYTVVADASSRTVGAVVAALPHAPGQGGPWHRLERGLDRVASWFNPFG